MNNIEIIIRGPHSEASYRRQLRHASRDSGSVQLEVYRTGKRVEVNWNANRGRGWMQGWKKSFATEAAALAFADTKWPSLVLWLETAELGRGRTAAEVFSTSLVGMRG